jgi:hypothetical protein
LLSPAPSVAGAPVTPLSRSPRVTSPSEVHHANRSVRDLGRRRKIQWFVDAGKGRVVAANSCGGRFEAQEALLGHTRNNLGTKATREGRLVCHQQPAGFVHRCLHSDSVPRNECPQVYDLCGDAMLCSQVICGLLYYSHLHTGRELAVRGSSCHEAPRHRGCVLHNTVATRSPSGVQFVLTTSLCEQPVLTTRLGGSRCLCWLWRDL